MDILSSTKKFLVLLAVLSIITGINLSGNGGLPSILGTATGLFVFSILLAAIPLAIYKLRGREMTSKQFISTIAVAWGILVLSQIIVKLNN